MKDSFTFSDFFFCIYDYISTQYVLSCHSFLLWKTSHAESVMKSQASFLSYIMKVCLHTCVGAHTDCACTHRQEWLSHHLPQDWMVLVQDVSHSFPLCGASEMIYYFLPKSFNWKITFTYATLSSNVQAILSSVVRNPSTQILDYFLLYVSIILLTPEHTFNPCTLVYFSYINIRAWRGLGFLLHLDF